MLQMVKRTLRNGIDGLLRPRGLELASFAKPGKVYSNVGEAAIIDGYMKQLVPGNRYFVDIGASWGLELSNTVGLAQQGWSGLAAEYDPDKFARLARSWKDFPVNLFRGRVMPDNVISILAAAEVPHDLAFLSLDIDSWDAYVLREILNVYRPALICTEVNVSFPPPVKFAVCPSGAPLWQGGYFYGQSIAFLGDIAKAAGYSLVSLHYNNAFLVPSETGLLALTPEEAYRIGYRDQPDRDAKFPYNSWLSDLWDLEPDALLASLQARLADQTAPYVLTL